MQIRIVSITGLILINAFISIAQSKLIKAEPYSLKAPGFNLMFTDCIETKDNDVIFVGRFEKGSEEVFDSVYLKSNKELPEWIDIDKANYRDSCPVKILLHRVNSAGVPIWTRLYDFGFSGIKMDIDNEGFIYVLANSYLERELNYRSDQAICPIVAKLDSSGAIIWIKQLLSDSYSRGIDLVISDNYSIGILASDFHLKIDTIQMKINPDRAIVPIPNSRFVLLDTAGNIISDHSIEMKENLVFNYPEELAQYNNEFYASISTAGHMSTISHLVKISTSGELGEFHKSGFISGSHMSGPKMMMSDSGEIYVTGHVNKDDSEFVLLVFNSSLKTVIRKNTIIKSHDSSYPVPTTDGLFIIGYDNGANQLVKYTKDMTKLWSYTFYKTISKHLLYDMDYKRGIVISNVVPAKNGGCYIIGSFETETYETESAVYALDKDGNLMW